MKVITFNNKFDPGYYRFLKTAVEHNYVPMRCPEKTWPGFMGRWKSIKKILDTLPEEEVVIVCDSSDVVFLRELSYEEIKEIEKSNLIYASKYHEVPYLRTFFNYNAGVLIAKVKMLKGLASFISESNKKEFFEDCDQSLINDAILGNKLYFKETDLIYTNNYFKNINKKTAVYHYVGATDFLIFKTKENLEKIGFKNLEDIRFDLRKWSSYVKKIFSIENRIRKLKE